MLELAQNVGFRRTGHGLERRAGGALSFSRRRRAKPQKTVCEFVIETRRAAGGG